MFIHNLFRLIRLPGRMHSVHCGNFSSSRDNSPNVKMADPGKGCQRVKHKIKEKDAVKI